MKKIYAFIIAVLTMASATPALAQNVYVWGTDDVVHVYPTESVDSVTFGTAANGLFTYEYSDEKIDESTYEVTVKASLISDLKGIDAENKPAFAIVYSAKNQLPTSDDSYIILGEAGSDTTFVGAQMVALISGTTYYYRVASVVGHGISYSDVRTFTTAGEKPADRSKIVNGHKFVDLGLNSGLLWAETNLGAKNAGQIGYYYAWGETASKDEFTSENSTWYDKLYEGGMSLTSEDDAATKAWGEDVRMPTKAEMEELVSDCYWKKTSSNGVDGYMVESKVNNNFIFLPAGGCRRTAEDYIYNENDCLIWSSSIGQDWEEGCSLHVGTKTNVFGEEEVEVEVEDSEARYCGLNIRPVTSGK